MPFNVKDTSHVPDSPGTLGATTGAIDNFILAKKRSLGVDSAYGFEIDLFDDWIENLQHASDMTGIDFVDNFMSWEGRPGRIDLQPDMMVLPESGVGREVLDNINNALTQWKEVYPSIRTLEDVTEDRRAAVEALLIEQTKVSERAKFRGMLGGLAGTIVGGFHPQRDPLYVGSMFLGAGAGRGILQKMLIEGVLGGLIEGAQQAAFVAPRYKKYNLSGNEPLYNVLAASLGAAAFSGSLSALGAAWRKAKTYGGRKAQREARDEALKKILPEGTDTSPKVKVTNRDLDTIADKVENKTPEQEIAHQQVKRKVSEENESRHAATKEGAQRTEAEIEEAEKVLRGEPVPRSLKAKAEAARAAPEPTLQERVEAQNPGIYKKLEDVDEELTKVREELRKLDSKQKKGESVSDEDVVLKAKEEISELKTAIAKQKERIEKLKGKKGTDNAVKGIEKAIKKYEARLEKLGTGDNLSPQMKGNIRSTLKKKVGEVFDEKLSVELEAAYLRLRGKEKALLGTVEGMKNEVKRLEAAEKRNQNAANASMRAARTVDEGTTLIDELAEGETFELDQNQLDAIIARMAPDEQGRMDIGTGFAHKKDVLTITTVDEETGKPRVMTAEEVFKEAEENKKFTEAVTQCEVGGRVKE